MQIGEKMGLEILIDSNDYKSFVSIFNEVWNFIDNKDNIIEFTINRKQNKFFKYIYNNINHNDINYDSLINSCIISGNIRILARLLRDVGHRKWDYRKSLTLSRNLNNNSARLMIEKKVGKENIGNSCAANCG